MKVAVDFRLDIDVESWMLTYGTPREDVRNDVKEHATNTITEHFRELGLLTEEDQS